MKYFTKALFFLPLMFLCMGSSYAVEKSCESVYQQKIYFDAGDLTVHGNTMHINFGEDCIEAYAVRADFGGLYVFAGDVLNKDYKCKGNWTCPYCGRSWPSGVPCQNARCPSKY